LNLVSQIPCTHKWLWSLHDPAKQQVKFVQRFCISSRYLPGSPRNRIINAVIANNNSDVIIKALHVILDIYDDDVSSQNRSRLFQKKRKLTEKRPRLSIDVRTICENLGIDEVEANCLSKNVSSSHQQQSLYLYFVEKIFSVGCISWRVKNRSLQVILMNDYDSETGDFKVNIGNNTLF